VLREDRATSSSSSPSSGGHTVCSSSDASTTNVVSARDLAGRLVYTSKSNALQVRLGSTQPDHPFVDWRTEYLRRHAQDRHYTSKSKAVQVRLVTQNKSLQKPEQNDAAAAQFLIRVECKHARIHLLRFIYVDHTVSQKCVSVIF